jgi:hypothetical protein
MNARVGTSLRPTRVSGMCSSGKYSGFLSHWSSQRQSFQVSIRTYGPTVNYFEMSSELVMKVFGGHTKRGRELASETL